MARIAAKVKLGYFPLPLEIARAVSKKLKGPAKRAMALDPCCGTGEAISVISTGMPLEIFGIEIDEFRAVEAQKKLGEGKVLNSSLEQSLIHGVCQFLYLNPPYEHEVGMGGKRVEVSFLELTMEALSERGVLVLAVPQRVLERLSDLLIRHFRKLSIFRGDERFKQVLVFGEKRREGDPASTQERTGFKRALSLPYESFPDVVDVSTNGQYQIPDAEETGFLELTRVGIDYEKIETSFLNSDGFKSLGSSGLWPTPRNDRPLKIIHPLTPGLTAVLMQAGMFDGQVFDPEDERCCVVKGSTVFHRIHEEKEVGEHLLEIREMDAPVTRITAASFKERTVFDLYPDKTVKFKIEEKG